MTLCPLHAVSGGHEALAQAGVTDPTVVVRVALPTAAWVVSPVPTTGAPAAAQPHEEARGTDAGRYGGTSGMGM